tara:strand:- start:1220 stop:1399 length:180 start_codon:yes stop_codon:yes gene_type:complete
MADERQTHWLFSTAQLVLKAKPVYCPIKKITKSKKHNKPISTPLIKSTMTQVYIKADHE